MSHIPPRAFRGEEGRGAPKFFTLDCSGFPHGYQCAMELGGGARARGAPSKVLGITEPVPGGAGGSSSLGQRLGLSALEMLVDAGGCTSCATVATWGRSRAIPAGVACDLTPGIPPVSQELPVSCSHFCLLPPWALGPAPPWLLLGDFFLCGCNTREDGPPTFLHLRQRVSCHHF